MTGVTDVAAPPRPPQAELSLPTSLLAMLVAGGALAATGRVGALGLLVAVAVVQAALAFAWVLGTGVPGRVGSLVVGGLAAAGADVAVSLRPDGRLGVLLVVLGLAVPVLFVHQLARGIARSQVVASLSATALLVLAEVSLTALLELRHAFGGGGGEPDQGGLVVAAAVGAVAAALAVGYLVDLLVPAPRFDANVPRGGTALVASTLVGAAVGYTMLRDVGELAGARAVFAGAALGAIAGLLAVGGAFVQATTPDPDVRRLKPLRPVLAALLPLTLVAPVAFLLCLAVRA